MPALRGPVCECLGTTDPEQRVIFLLARIRRDHYKFHAWGQYKRKALRWHARWSTLP